MIGDSPTRVLLTVDAVGGVWQYATDLAQALVPLGFETMLALIGPAASTTQRATVAAIPGAALIDTGLPLDWLAETPQAVRDAGTQLAALAEQLNVDLVHLNHPALADGVEWSVPLLVTVHSCLATWWEAVETGPLPPAFVWRAAQHGRGLQMAARVVAPSRAFAAATARAYGLTAPEVVYNGRSTVARRTAPIADFAFTAGRLWDRGKNIGTLDRAASQMHVPVRVAGPLAGPDGHTVDVRHLHPLGRLDDAAVAARLAQRPVFVSAARYEPFGLAVLEAAAAGCALVLAGIPTFRELWRDAAVFVAPDDAAGFARAINTLVADPVARDLRGRAARTIAARLTPERMAGGMAIIYSQLLANGGARARVAA